MKYRLKGKERERKIRKKKGEKRGKEIELGQHATDQREKSEKKISKRGITQQR